MVVIGKIGAPFGVKGWIKVHSYTDPADNIINYKHWTLKIGQIEVDSIQCHGKIFIAKLKGFDNRDQAQTLTNLEIKVERKTFKTLADGEYYWHDLAGMKVFTDKNQYLGTVFELFNHGASDIMVVKGEESEHLIPFILDKHVLNIDVTAKKITVHWEFEG